MKKGTLIVLVLVVVLVAIFATGIRIYETMTIDYSQPVGELIQAGNYSSVSIQPENYKIKKNGVEKIEVKLFTFHFPANEYREEYVLKAISDKGYRPANFTELLHYKISHPNPKINIIALGSVYIDVARYKNSPFIHEFIDSNNIVKYRLDEDGARLGYFSTNNLNEIGFLAVKN